MSKHCQVRLSCRKLTLDNDCCYGHVNHEVHFLHGLDDEAFFSFLSRYLPHPFLHSVVLDGSDVTVISLHRVIRAAQPWLVRVSLRWCSALNIKHLIEMFELIIDGNQPFALEKISLYGSRCAPVLPQRVDDGSVKSLRSLHKLLARKKITTDITFCEASYCFGCAGYAQEVVNTELYNHHLHGAPFPTSFGLRYQLKVIASRDYQPQGICFNDQCTNTVSKKIICVTCRLVQNCRHCSNAFCLPCVANLNLECHICGTICKACILRCRDCGITDCPDEHQGTGVQQCTACKAQLCEDCTWGGTCDNCYDWFCEDCIRSPCDEDDCEDRMAAYCHPCYDLCGRPMCDVQHAVEVLSDGSSSTDLCDA